MHVSCRTRLHPLALETMKLPSPRAQLAGCVWLPRILAKARLLQRGALEPEYVGRFCHPTGTDGQFLGFFQLTKEELLAVCDSSDEAVAAWFTSLASAGGSRIAEWNHIAINLGRPGFPMAERLPVALATTYRHLAGRHFETVFEVLEADEAGG